MIKAITAAYQAQTTTITERYAEALKRASTADAVFVCPPAAQTQTVFDATKSLSGLIFSVKDTFDQAGQITRAGAIVPALDTPAQSTATAVQRLIDAGAIPFGRTNMSEFAFSGLGLNPHYGSPKNAIDANRISGGSTSGGAVSVALGCCDFALGTDTGGSLRIPAAFNGLTGFKPTQHTVPSDGCFPLSPSLDCVGPIAKTVSDCCSIWQALSQTTENTTKTALHKKLLIPSNVVLTELDEAVKAGFEMAINTLKSAGWAIVEQPLPVLDQVFAINASGGLVLPESAWVHRKLLTDNEAHYDPLIAARIQLGATTPLTDYIDRLQQRPILQRAFAAAIGDYDAVLCPTTATIPPTFTAVNASADAFNHYNRLALRNTALFNYLDSPSISLPFYAEGANLPIGVMLSGVSGHDVKLLALAGQIEKTLAND